MTLRAYLSFMIIATSMAAVAWGFVLYYIDPYSSGVIGLTLFYTTLFFMLVGIFTIIGFKIRQRLLNNELVYILVGMSFRQAIWLSIICIGLLLMQGARILSWWDAALLVVSVFLLEAYFISD